MTASNEERLGIVETKVENLTEKIDEIKHEVKESGNVLKEQLEKMYDASCSQHAGLAKEISELKKFKEKWVYIVAGVVAAGGFFAGHADKILKLIA